MKVVWTDMTQQAERGACSISSSEFTQLTEYYGRDVVHLFIHMHMTCFLAFYQTIYY